MLFKRGESHRIITIKAILIFRHLKTDMALQAECFALKSHHDKFLLYISVQFVVQAGRAAEALRLCAVLIPKIPKPISANIMGSGISTALSAIFNVKSTGVNLMNTLRWLSYCSQSSAYLENTYRCISSE